ncbi:MAG TPA: hypothetical protein VFR11_16550 [Micromonosporaceae bacterium]|nr:hypothetical protein [Micromonosporaceae bacterium]
MLDPIALDYWLVPTRTDEMPFLAAKLLAAGYDTPALRQAAGFTAKDDPRDIRDAFREALEELGVWLADALTAQMYASKIAAGDMVTGRRSIAECTRRVREVFDLDDLIDSSLPADLHLLVLMSWLFPGDEYEANGGDDRLL